MIRWIFVVAIGALLWSIVGVCETLEPELKHTSHTATNTSYLLSQLLKEIVLDRHNNNCNANLISGGSIAFKNDTSHTMRNFTVSRPILFVSCSNETTGSIDYSSLLKKFAGTVNSMHVVDDMHHYLKRDNFRNSILMIAFTMCAICVGKWMVYLTLFFQKCPQHVGRRSLLMVYVVFTSIYESINLNMAVQKIFKKQYNGNYQNAMEYEKIIVASTSYQVEYFITNVLACFNWISIIYYMFQNRNRIHKIWLPKVVSNRNRIIIGVGLSLTMGEQLVLALLLWYRYNNALRIAYLLIELCIYLIFCGLVSYFVYHDFGFTLAPKSSNINNGKRVMQFGKMLWKDYHEVLPLLIHNLCMFGLLFFTRIYLYVAATSGRKWLFKVIEFFKIVITVSVWGLITVLEKRDSIVSRETVLGRKINRSDQFFHQVDMNRKNDIISDSITVNSNLTTCECETVTRDPDLSEMEKDVGLFKFKSRPRIPTKALFSQLKSAKESKKGIRRSRLKYFDILAGTNTIGKKENTKIFKHVAPNGSTAAEERNRNSANPDKPSEDGEESEVNYIYDLKDYNGM